jgi:acylphosphatase
MISCVVCITIFCTNKGTVKNLRDGRVEAYCRGTEEQLTAMGQFLHRGSPHARVSGVEVRALDADDRQYQFSTFTIIRK